MMKAFKKWFNRSSWLEVRACEAGWRAALEWVLTTAQELNDQDAPIGMEEVIEQELKEN